MAQEWLRLYRSAVNNPKIQRLGLEAVGFWCNLLCLSDDDGNLKPVKDIAWAMRLDETVTETFLVTFQRNGLVDTLEDGSLRLHDWDDHQFRSDNSTDRVRKFRSKQRVSSGETFQPVSGNVSETPQNRTEQNRVCVAPERSPPKRATRWDASDPIPPEWLAEANQIRTKASLSPVDPALEAARFVDFWAAKSGKDATKADWHATWRNWIRNSRGGAAPNGSGRVPMGPA